MANEITIYHGITSDARPSYWAASESHAMHFAPTVITSTIDLDDVTVVHVDGFDQQEWRAFRDAHPDVDVVTDYCDGKDTLTYIIMNDDVLHSIIDACELAENASDFDEEMVSIWTRWGHEWTDEDCE